MAVSKMRYVKSFGVYRAKPLHTPGKVGPTDTKLNMSLLCALIHYVECSSLVHKNSLSI